VKKRPSHEDHPARRPTYRMRQFATLGGVTVKALLHYDRLGLLAPARTSAGHRLYSEDDLDRLRRILALKRVGVALTQMRDLLDADPETLSARLRASREALARERERLLRADRAIALVEESLRHTPADRRGLSRLADVIDMRRDVAGMRRYFSDDAWEVAQGFYEAWPDESWIGLYREIASTIPEGPASPRAEDLLRRWNVLAQSLWRELASDRHLSRQLHEGFAKAWRDRANWPDTLRRRFADYEMNEVAAFLGRVSIVVMNRRGTQWFAERRDTPAESTHGAAVR
jgi:DNA-binding transcriptional MerR regulator